MEGTGHAPLEDGDRGQWPLNTVLCVPGFTQRCVQGNRAPRQPSGCPTWRRGCHSRAPPMQAGTASPQPPPGACGQRQAGTGLLLIETWPPVSFLCPPPGQSLGTRGGGGGWPPCVGEGGGGGCGAHGSMGNTAASPGCFCGRGPGGLQTVLYKTPGRGAQHRT